MWIAQIVSPWTQTDGRAYPVLAELLGPGSSISDVTGSPNVAQDPNANTWELRDPTGDTLAAAEADNRFTVLQSEEVPDAET